MTRPVTERRAYTQKEAAALYGVSLNTIKRARATGDLVMHNIATDPNTRPSWRVTAEALDTWFTSLEASA
jgi:hypothetical protein